MYVSRVAKAAYPPARQEVGGQSHPDPLSDANQSGSIGAPRGFPIGTAI